MQKFLCILFLCILSLFQSSCNRDESLADVPAYIRIEKADFIITDPLQGSATSKISDIWLYVNDQLIGAFELRPDTPFLNIPVLDHGLSKITVRAGIKINGITATRANYEFYQDYVVTEELKPKETLTINPVYKYRQSTVFAWMNNFENENKIDTLPNSKAELQVITDPSIIDRSLNGFACGSITLTPEKNIFAASSLLTEPLRLPTTGAAVFLEMDYMNNNKFTVGLMARRQTSDQALLYLDIRPSATWNKIYVNLSSILYENYDASGFFFFMYAEKDQNNPEAKIYIDNLKIVH
jgi:hypothetical protein